jgi:hypothetical protein
MPQKQPPAKTAVSATTEGPGREDALSTGTRASEAVTSAMCSLAITMISLVEDIL